ncbi:MAG: sigma 54-interacting transcriptional regulator [Myxococcales bacterium]
MVERAETTGAEDDSIAIGSKPQLWLHWVSPHLRPPIAVEHGLVIGRDSDCAVSLPGRGLSRKHAELYRQGPIFALKDLGSRNGTFLNGRRTQHGPVAPGAVLRVSEYVGVFSEWSGAPPVFRRISDGLYGGAELQTLMLPLERASKSDIPIVVIGSTGTGKECVARAVHELSGRAGPFHAINCAALPKDLAEAELFGHRKGAFTGAEGSNLGHFRAAHLGTLFLDEVAELTLPIQAKLLRALEERSVIPLGDTKSVPIDVRIVAAAPKPLAAFVSAQALRRDLVARLSGLAINLPQLHDRPADIAPLFRHFMTEYSGGVPPEVDAKLIECLCMYDWPTNVRGLGQLARQLLAVHGTKAALKRSLLPPELLSNVPSGADSAPPPALAPVERKAHDKKQLAAALVKNDGNVAVAAASLGFSRHRAYRLLEGREVSEFVASELPHAE